MGETRPKLEIVRTDTGVAFYLNGKCLDETTPDRNACYAAESIAKELARALGAEVVDADQPTPEPYRYFITYAVLATGWKAALVNPGQVLCSRWVSLDKDIEGPADTEAISRMIADEFSYPVLVNILGVTLMDGPC